MNSQQAINLLKGLEQSLDDYCELNDEGKAAFRMAITALNRSETPNNSGTISRQAAIDEIKRSRFLVDAVEKVIKLPPTQPEPQWIPVGKKYPPVDEEVLVTYSVDRRKRRYVDIAHWSGNDWLSMLDEYRVPGHAIRYHAWKPLPKPYKGGKQ